MNLDKESVADISKWKWTKLRRDKKALRMLVSALGHEDAQLRRTAQIADRQNSRGRSREGGVQNR